MADLAASPASSGGRQGQLDAAGLRPGWTTGACATAAARAAYQALLTGAFPDPVIVELPQGRRPAFALTTTDAGDGWAEASVTKDAGDDPDVTHGAVVRVRVAGGVPGAGVRFEAGPGVGTVTLPGLPLAVGEPAINPMPRAMIVENLDAVARLAGLAGADAAVRVGVDGGEELARHTLNRRLGIVGGLSILGTTGVVVPYSCSAWIASIHRGIDVARAAGVRRAAACTGSTSERVARELGVPEVALLDMGDFAGAVLKHLRAAPIPELVIVGGVGKLAKLAAGHLDLHSARSSVDLDFLAGLAEAAGGAGAVAEGVRTQTTALGAVTFAAQAGVPLGDAIAQAARRASESVLDGAPVAVSVVCIDRAGTMIGRAMPRLS